MRIAQVRFLDQQPGNNEKRLSVRGFRGFLEMRPRLSGQVFACLRRVRWQLGGKLDSNKRGGHFPARLHAQTSGYEPGQWYSQGIDS